VGRAGDPETLLAGLGELGVDDAAVFRAPCPLDEAGALEPLEQPGDAGRSEQDALSQVNTAQQPVRRLRQLQENLEVVDREPVRRNELAVQAPKNGGMSA
jgi:hypothetical protein